MEKSKQIRPPIKRPTAPTKKGMWAERGGEESKVGVEYNTPLIQDEIRALNALLMEYYARLIELDKLIELSAEALRTSQPIGMYHSIDVRWWKLKGGDKWRTPVLVCWIPQANGVMTPKPVSPNTKIKQTPYSDLNYDNATELLSIVRDLILERKALRKRQQSIRASLRNLDKKKLKFHEIKSRVLTLQQVSSDRLSATGYTKSQ
ncbi:hypothetical protein [Sulfuriferula nivalis]|uniref:Uncharacterized protein n=1 Tax=Sulfuriferula nivalis TaxID=2675298 RepID=A0A809RNV5_9PROT|nr:hypothetical protein [Sulfuriferula nivalis]BBP02464.1 hypothetical protein SFSGTM_31720 [Sulfuriferula nivalis]